MGLPRFRSTPARSQQRPTALVVAFLLALATAIGLGGAIPAQGASSLALEANSSALAKVGPSRLTSIAEVAVKVPATTLEAGLQFRANAKSSGYRANVTVAANGAITGSFSRVKSSKQTAIGSARPLGFTVHPGDSIRLEATVVAKKTVRLYLRAWKKGAAKPSAWQLTAKDTSSSRDRQGRRNLPVGTDAVG